MRRLLHAEAEPVRDLDLPPDASLGLSLYGHRRKGDCADIERFPPVGQGSRGELVAVIEGINPKGRTPIADSLRIVGESLKAYEGSSSIVLVSDGIESCEQDPCDVARELREDYGIEVVIHVVGFDVQEGQEQLRCIAEAGGGRFFAARDARELAGAFQQVQEEVAKPPPPPPPPPPAEPEAIDVAAAANGGRIVLYSSEFSDWTAAKLIDGTSEAWVSETNAPQSIVIGFRDDRRARIEDLLVDPSSHLTQDRWAKSVMLYASQDSPWEGYEWVGALTLDPGAGEQVLSFDPPIEARYLELRFISNHGGSNHISAAEVRAMGHLLDGPPPPPALENLAAAMAGGRIEKASSEFSDWTAAKLVDGGPASWCSNGAPPREVTIALAGAAPRQVALLAVTPHSTMDPSRWAREVEVLTSEESAYKGFVSQGRLALEKSGHIQTLRLPEPAPARYVRLRFLSNQGGSNHVCAGEVVVLGQ